MSDQKGLILTSIDQGKIEGLSVFKYTLDQDTLNSYLDQDGCIDLNQLKSDLFSKQIKSRPKLVISNIPLTGDELLKKIKEDNNLTKSEIAKVCGYSIIKEDGSEQIRFTDFYKALLDAKLSGSSPATNKEKEENSEKDKKLSKGSKEETNIKKSKIKSLYDLFNSYNYNETDWLFSGPILKDLIIESDNINIKGHELLKKLNKENIDTCTMESLGKRIDEELIHLFVEIPIQSKEEKIIINDTFDESKILKIDTIDNLNISLLETPSQEILY